MADNISITPGSGATVRTDEVGATQIQVVKIALGADGAEDNLVDSGQQASAASVPVVIASDQSAVPVSGPLTDTQLRATAVPVSVASVPSHAVTNAGTFAVQESGAALTALQLIDNMISGNEAQVDVVTLPALPAGNNNIGDVDVASVIPGTGATNLGKAEDGAHTSGDVGVMALGVRNENHDDFSGTDKDYVPIAVDATGDVYVNFRHALAAGDNNIGNVDLASAIPAGDNNIGNVDIVTMPNVTIGAALPAGTNAIGKLAANSGVDIGDVDVTSLPALAAGTNTIGNVKDAGPSQTVTRTYTYNADISTARDITAAPTAGQKIVAMDIFVTVDTDCVVSIVMETSANVLWAAPVYARTPVQISLRGYLKGDAADKKLQMKSSVAAAGYCTAVYFSEA